MTFEQYLSEVESVHCQRPECVFGNGGEVAVVNDVMFNAVGFSVSYGQPLVEERLKAFRLRSTLIRPPWGSRWIRFG